MGVQRESLDYLAAKGLLQPGMRVLDVGAQNLYLLTAEWVRGFLRDRGCTWTDATLATFAEGMAAGGVAEGEGFRNGAFLGDLLAAAGLKYHSIDVFERPRNIIADLNGYDLPAEMRGAFDLVLNFGTTEHVVNQYNCFRVIHEATKPGGWMFHQVPTPGLFDHGYFTYNRAFFSDLARANEYKVERLDTIGTGLHALLHKRRALPFRLPMELSTSIAPAALRHEAPPRLRSIPSAELARELWHRQWRRLRRALRGALLSSRRA